MDCVDAFGCVDPKASQNTIRLSVAETATGAVSGSATVARSECASGVDARPHRGLFAAEGPT
jgi:hypothetical protein